MALTILNNIASIAAENQLSITSSNLQSTLFQLSSGSRINTGADDAAGLAQRTFHDFAHHRRIIHDERPDLVHTITPHDLHGGLPPRTALFQPDVT